MIAFGLELIKRSNQVAELKVNIPMLVLSDRD